MGVDDGIGLNHVEFHTTEPEELLNVFIKTYGFVLRATKTTCDYSQWLLDSYQCRLIISSTSNIKSEIVETKTNDHYDILTTLINDEKTKNLIINRKTVFNLALNVKSVQTILDKNPDVKVLVSRRQAVDEYGTIDYACIKSSIGNIVHTIMDTSNYSGKYLPGFIPVNVSSNESKQSIVSNIDHVAIAVNYGIAQSAINWYQNTFGLKRFPINREDDPFQGFLVNVGSMGMRMFSGVYWKCAEIGCADSTNSLKFVFVESLIQNDSNATDQITTFIKNHNDQAGIQHIAFTCLNNIKDAVRTTKQNGAQFLTPCLDYYSQENNGKIIEDAEENPVELSELGILLDDEADASNNLSTEKNTKQILLQIFTTSIFNNDTFFLELIERRGATGFGSGNVRTLWKIVQRQMDRNK